MWKKSGLASILILAVLTSACAGPSEDQSTEEVGENTEIAADNDANDAGQSSSDSTDTAFAGKTLRVLCFSALSEETFNENIAPRFEEKYGVKVEYTPESSTATYTKLMATKDNPQYDVACMASGILQKAQQDGLLVENDPEIVNNYFQHVPESLRTENDTGIYWRIAQLGMVYDIDQYEAQGMDAPTSWNDLLRPENKNHLAVPVMNTADGQATLIMMAVANGGSESDIEPGLDAYRTVVANATVIAKPDFTQYFAQEEIWIASMVSSRAQEMAEKTGLNTEFVVPDEGSFANRAGMAVVAGAEEAELGQHLLNFMLEAETQELIANSFNEMPVVDNLATDAQLPDMVVKQMESIESLYFVDDAIVADNVQDWIDEVDSY